MYSRSLYWQECEHFFSRYLDKVKIILNRYGRNYEAGLQQFNKSKFKVFLQVGNYVLQKCDELSPFIE